MIKRKLFIVGSGLLFLIYSSNIMAQNKLGKSNQKTDSTTVISKPLVARNMMLNASADNGPRAVNIGLPASVGGTTILENGLPVVYDFTGQLPILLWRADAGISKFQVLNVSETARLASDIGVSVNTYTNRGTDFFRGSVGYTTNSFGLQRVDIGVSGPLKNGFQYSLTAFLNLDPGTFHSNISMFMDKTQIYKGVLNKKYSKGQIGIQYKYAYSEGQSAKQSPYIYKKNGKVDQLPFFKIGRDSYLEQSGLAHIVDPLTGEEKTLNVMGDAASASHVIDIFGDHKLDNGLNIDYTARYHYAKSGSAGSYLTSIKEAFNPNNTPQAGDKRYYYVDNPAAPYIGLIQNGMMIYSPKSTKNTLMARLDISKNTQNHHWSVGIQNWAYIVDKANSASYNYQFEVAPNPRGLLMEQFDGTNWISKTDKYGNSNYNVGLQYYDGLDNKLALIGSENWTINDKLSFDLGTRIEWQRIDGKWYTREAREAAKTNWISGNLSDIKKDWYNVTGTFNGIYKLSNTFGFMADAMYIQKAGNLSLYGGGDDPETKKSVTSGFSAGVYFNHPMVSLVSKVTQIERTNFNNNSTFNSPDGTAIVRKVISYDVQTVGWTTDILLSPFKGFNLHMLLTLQNPKYKNYDFEVFDEKFSNSGNIARSVSKTIIEIDPSYSWKNFRLWASARYFSKEFANYPNTLIFASRWETFAGFNYKYNKKIEFNINAVNLFRVTGAQGSISGSNTTTAEQAKKLYDKPLVGTYIRPFTIEFSTKIKF